jgi:hypothetical protein
VSEQDRDVALDGAFQARTWSTLGPYGIGNRWFWAGRSGHGRLVRIAGHRLLTALTSAAEAALDRVRTSHSNSCRGPAALANEAQIDEPAPVLNPVGYN